MISSNGTVTPQARNQEGTEDIREAIGAITETLGNLEGSFVEMNGKSTMLAALSPSPQDAVQDLQALRKQLREETEKRDKDIDSFKRVAREDVKVKIAANLQDDILEYIKAEISAQVKQQVDLHIQDHIPISLKEQSQANKAQLREAKTSLINSAARKKNSSLRIQNLDDALEPVLKSDGTRGKLYPADLRSLLSYDTASLGDLIRDYGLVEDAVREVNLNVFLSHIGIPFEIVSLEDVNAKSDTPSLALVHQAYCKFTHSELVLFLLLRNLPTDAYDDSELASRLAHHDLNTYHFPPTLALPPVSPALTPPSKPLTLGPDLPVEILADIMDHVGDWELAKAVGVPTSLSRPSAWSRASPVDEAMLKGYLPLIRAADPIAHPPLLGADLAIRFGYVDVLDFLLLESARLGDGSVFKKLYKNDHIPIKASLHGRLSVLSWWKHGLEKYPDLIPAPSPGSISQALLNASYHGKIEILDWWLGSGLQLIFDQDVLTGATRHNRPEVLEWWDKSRLPIKYRLCDIEEALEDAIGGGAAARAWWRGGKGVDFNANDKEWMKLQNLN
ncbi:hypothetical protein R3P38DRAFT_2497994 [Favolaschia claudopus]|uniref:Uncharacterized protein n=1 Tax=Favolaschia claudopus TaxID=2862362 RepID=A0AAW0E234_9AGAR